MAVFSYKAIDHHTTLVSGVIHADSARQARDLLRSRGLHIDRIDTEKPRQRRLWRRSRHPAKVLSMARELSTLLSVGVPLLEALDNSVDQHHGSFQSLLLAMRERVAAGGSLADAMREHRHVFDELCIQLTEVGEDSGTLDQTLQRLAEFKERSQQFKGRVLTALTYPVIVLVAAVAISIFLMTFVVPGILEPLVELGRPLPLPTLIIKTASDFLLNWWWALCVALLSLIGLLTAGLKTSKGRRWRDTLILSVPVLGTLVRKQAVVRIAMVVATLSKSGVMLVRALEVSRGICGNVRIQEAVEACEKAVTAGGDIATALRQTQAFPALMSQIFATGQASGKLEEMLERLAQSYDQEVAAAAQRLTSALEPLLIVILALLVLCIAMATMLPILEAGDVLG